MLVLIFLMVLFFHFMHYTVLFDFCRTFNLDIRKYKISEDVARIIVCSANQEHS